MTRSARTGPIRLALVTAFLATTGCGGQAEPAPEVPVGTEEGLRAPELHGLRDDGSEFSSGFADGRPAVLVFYRSANCGLCRVQLVDLERNYGAYVEEDAEVLGLTLDPPQQNLSLTDELGLSFDVISVDTTTFREWGALSESGGTPLPATYVIDGSGLVRFRQIGRNAGDRATDADVVTVLHRILDP